MSSISCTSKSQMLISGFFATIFILAVSTEIGLGEFFSHKTNEREARGYRLTYIMHWGIIRLRIFLKRGGEW